MPVYDDEKEKQLGDHDSLNIPQEHREAEVEQLENQFNQPSFEPNRPTSNNSFGLSALAESEGHPLTNEHEDSARSSKSPNGLAVAEEGISGSGKSGAEIKNSSDQVGKGFSGATATSSGAMSAGTRKVVVKALNKHKKGALIGGGVGGGLIIVAVLAFGGLVSYEIVHIEENLLGYETKIETRIEKKAANDLLQRMICWQLKAGCKSGPNTEDNNKPTNQEEATAQQDGEVLTEEMDKFDLTNPKIKADLASQGIKEEIDPTTGQLTGLEDAQGNQIAEDISNNPVAASELEAALPEQAVGITEVYRPMLVDQAGVSFSGLPDNADTNVEKTVETEVDVGAGPEDFANASGEVTAQNEQPPPKTNPADLPEYTQASEATGKLGDAINAVDKAEQSGASGTAATEAGVKAFGGFSDPLFLSSIATTACTLKHSVVSAAIARVPTIITLLMRHGNVLLSIADQIKTGHITSKEVGSFMSLLNGNPSAPPGPNGQPSQASLPFSSSATWQEATGGKVTSANPGMSPAALPTANSGTTIVNEINGVMSKLGLNLGCNILTSWFGTLVQVGMGIGQVVTDIGSFGTTQVAITAAVLGFQSTLQDVVLPHVLQYFTPVGINGGENSVQWLNNAGAGINLSSADYARRMGGVPLTTNQAGAIAKKATQAVQVAQAAKPWVERTFALSDPYSLASRLALDMPIGLNQTVASIENVMINLPSEIMHNLAVIFNSGRAFAAATSTASYDPGYTNGITQYGFTSGTINQYNPITNEQYLFSNITYNGKSVRRIDALGNPNTYVDSPSGDPNNNDLLHCFVDSFYTIEIAAQKTPNQGADQYCHSMGSFDYNGTNNPTSQPTNADVIKIYCNALGNPTGCASGIAPQINNDVGRYRQYLLDTHVMADYTSMINSK